MMINGIIVANGAQSVTSLTFPAFITALYFLGKGCML